jgi:hypothetical protein
VKAPRSHKSSLLESWTKIPSSSVDDELAVLEEVAAAVAISVGIHAKEASGRWFFMKKR